MDYLILIIIIGVIFLVILLMYASKEAKQRKERMQERWSLRIQKKEEVTLKLNSKIKRLTETIFVWNKVSNFILAIAFDEINMKLAIVNKEGNVFLLGKGDITKCELRTKTKTISKGETTKKGSIPRAIVGGVVAGGAGAIVGGISTKENHKTTTQSISSYFIDFYTNCPELPYVIVSGIEEDLRKWYGYILLFITPEKEKTIKKYSVADEILKFKELLDNGLITLEEFTTEKEKLLSQNQSL